MDFDDETMLHFTKKLDDLKSDFERRIRHLENDQ